jgi:hypothetical protein
MESNEFLLDKYIDIDKYDGLIYFLDELIQEDKSVIEGIKPLTIEYSCFLWNRYVSKTNRHLMLLNNNEWPRHLERQNYNWNKDWNKGCSHALSNYLSQNVQYSKEDIIYFFWMREHSVETNWNLFLRHWIYFLYEDEGPIILNPTSDISVSFGPDGSLCIGKRNALE